ncbi:Uncharacterised protein [Mycobacteroides abscessus subsp. abscessus]|nr:Uncharacterised protein [Mycobacteroides abscessus subsp. abscessus]
MRHNTCREKHLRSRIAFDDVERRSQRRRQLTRVDRQDEGECRFSHHLRHRKPVARRDQMPDPGDELTAVQVPLCRTPMERRNLLWAFNSESVAEKLA